jgi:hypothetical protein
MGQVRTIAQGLKILTLQGVAVGEKGFGVPTWEGQLLHVGREGTIVPLVDLVKVGLGVPSAIAEHKGDWLVTVSDFSPLHYLVRVQGNGAYSKIADLSELSGEIGGPFGVAVQGEDYVVTLSTNTIEGLGVLLRVDEKGAISTIASLKGFGNPFGVVVRDSEFVVAQSQGQLLRVDAIGQVSVVVDLKATGLGIPLGIVVRQDDLFVTTSLGWVVKVDRQGKADTIVNLLEARFGIPSGIGLEGADLIVTTNSGYLLRIQLQKSGIAL